MSNEALRRAEEAALSVVDPEIPALTLSDLGVLRGLAIAEDGAIEATITPTYTGCPAMKTMERDLVAALAAAGFAHVRVKTTLTPVWTTDLLSAEAREKLRACGIAPPVARAARRGRFADDAAPPCPLCDSPRTNKVSEFGSTACKSLWRCEACLEPFDAFKCI